MNCMKCGRDIGEFQVFCPECLEVMEKYPVKPNTAVQLPKQDAHTHTRKAQSKRRQGPTIEERLKSTQRILRRVVILWLITLGLLVALLYPAVLFIMDEIGYQAGQNYSTFSTESADSTTSP